MRGPSVGFTLLELLVALAIFAIIAVLAYGGLNTVLTVRAHTDAQAAQLRQLQMAFSRLQQDISQYVARPVRNAYGDSDPALLASATQLTLTRTGWTNPLAQPRSVLQRVQYRWQDETLWRDHWQVLDQAQDSSPYALPLLSPITAIEWQFLDQQLTWHRQWPPAKTLNTVPLPTASTETPAAAEASAPRLLAIELRLTLPQWGELTRLFAVAEGQYAPSPP